MINDWLTLENIIIHLRLLKGRLSVFAIYESKLLFKFWFEKFCSHSLKLKILNLGSSHNSFKNVRYMSSHSRGLYSGRRQVEYFVTVE